MTRQSDISNLPEAVKQDMETFNKCKFPMELLFNCPQRFNEKEARTIHDVYTHALRYYNDNIRKEGKECQEIEEYMKYNLADRNRRFPFFSDCACNRLKAYQIINITIDLFNKYFKEKDDDIEYVLNILDELLHFIQNTKKPKTRGKK